MKPSEFKVEWSVEHDLLVDNENSMYFKRLQQEHSCMKEYIDFLENKIINLEGKLLEQLKNNHQLSE